jgi:hypothetical protein
MLRIKRFDHAPSPHQRIGYCLRCRHAVAFCQAFSDMTWVCQKCLRYRILGAELLASPTQSDHQQLIPRHISS